MGKETGIVHYCFHMPDVPVVVRVVRAQEYAAFGTASLVLPAGTLAVEDGAFEGDTSILSVEIPEVCESIGIGAFRNCTILAKIRIPGGCAIGEEAFSGCREVLIYGVKDSPADIWCRLHPNCTFVEE